MKAWDWSNWIYLNKLQVQIFTLHFLFFFFFNLFFSSYELWSFFFVHSLIVRYQCAMNKDVFLREIWDWERKRVWFLSQMKGWIKFTGNGKWVWIAEGWAIYRRGKKLTGVTLLTDQCEKFARSSHPVKHWEMWFQLRLFFC